MHKTHKMNCVALSHFKCIETIHLRECDNNNFRIRAAIDCYCKFVLVSVCFLFFGWVTKNFIRKQKTNLVHQQCTNREFVFVFEFKKKKI